MGWEPKKPTLAQRIRGARAKEECYNCGGTGHIRPRASKPFKKCPDCNGKGWTRG